MNGSFRGVAGTFPVQSLGGAWPCQVAAGGAAQGAAWGRVVVLMHRPAGIGYSNDLTSLHLAETQEIFMD